jgi:hypothetical protein
MYIVRHKSRKWNVRPVRAAQGGTGVESELQNLSIDRAIDGFV